MNDREEALESGRDQEEAAANADLPANVTALPTDDSPTDPRLPMLMSAPTAEGASTSLGRLESDLRSLQSKWQAVERDMSDRDRQIAALTESVDSYKKKLEEAAADLEAAATSQAELNEELDSVMADRDSWRDKSSNSDREISQREDTISDFERQRAELEKENIALAEELARLGNDASQSSDKVKELGARNTELRVHIQELQDYIDGRKDDWETQTRSLRDYENTITSMAEEMDGFGKVVDEKDQEKAALAEHVMTLERDLAMLRGRHEERENSHAALQGNVNEQARELGSLNKEVLRLRREIEKLEKKLAKREESLKSVREGLKESKAERNSLEKDLGGSRSTINDLEKKLSIADVKIAKLEKQRDAGQATEADLNSKLSELKQEVAAAEPSLSNHANRIEELERELSDRKLTEQSLRDEAEATAGKLEEARTKASEFEIKAIELEAVLLEGKHENKGLESELEAQRELIGVLEKELSSKQQNLDVLDRSADRLSAISGGIRELDSLLDDCLHTPEAEGTSDDIDGDADVSIELEGELADEIMIAPEELFAESDAVGHVIIARHAGDGSETRYSLDQDTLTIGRSRKSTIRLTNKYISRVHARIHVEGSQAVIEDAGSTNGFLVNSVQKLRHKLRHGDMLELGTDKLLYLCESEPEQPDITL